MTDDIITSPNGITLNPKGGWADSIEKYAKQKLGNDYRAFLATDVEGKKTYLLVKGSEPIHEDQNFESMCCRIDMLWAVENLK